MRYESEDGTVWEVLDEEERIPKTGEHYLSCCAAVLRADSDTVTIAGINGGRRKILRPVSQNFAEGKYVTPVPEAAPAPQKDVTHMTPEAFYQHVWGFPAPFEVGVKPNIASVPEPCPCCKGLREFSHTDHVPNGILHYKEVCPECLGKGTA